MLRFFLRHRAAVAGGDGVKEDEVGAVEPRGFVVNKLIGRRGGLAVVGQCRPAWRHRGHMQPDRSGAGAAVKAKREWPGGRISDVVQRVGDKKYLGLGLQAIRGLLVVILVLFLIGRWRGWRALDQRLPLLLLEQEVAGGGVIFQDLAGEADRVGGDGEDGFGVGLRLNFSVGFGVALGRGGEIDADFGFGLGILFATNSHPGGDEEEQAKQPGRGYFNHATCCVRPTRGRVERWTITESCRRPRQLPTNPLPQCLQPP